MKLKDQIARLQTMLSLHGNLEVYRANGEGQEPVRAVGTVCRYKDPWVPGKDNAKKIVVIE